MGALLAAVGTALPESTIPVVALISGGDEAETIAIGSIVGAPFLLGTLAMLLVAVSALGFRGRRANGADLDLDVRGLRRDLVVFLGLFAVAVALGLGAPLWARIAGAVLLVLGYAAYVYRPAVASGDAGDPSELEPLRFDTTKDDPPSNLQIGLQLVVSIAAIITGAELFVHEVEAVAKAIGIETLVLTLILAPLATELPEKINSVVWVRQGKDDLALGNITGAMTFQATIPVAVGLTLTEWDLDRYSLVACLIALLGGAIAYACIGRRHFGRAPSLVWGLLFAGFTAYAVLS